MSFTIPNEADAGDANQAEPDSVDFDALALAYELTGVLRGCAPSDGASGLDIDVAEGQVMVAGRIFDVSAVTVTPGAADGSNPRFDLVTVDDTGTVAVVAGTADANPVFPAIPADEALIAAAYIDAGVTTLASADIVDKRVPVRPLYQVGLPVGEYFTSQVAPDEETASPSNTVANSNNRVQTLPLYVPSRISVDRIGVRIQSLPDSSGNGEAIRLGVYRSNEDGQPDALLFDAGTIAAGSGDSTGTQTITISETIDPGIYHLASVWQNIGNSTVNPTWSSMNDASTVQAPTPAIPVNVGAGGKISAVYRETGVSGSLSDPFSVSGGPISIGDAHRPAIVFLRRS